MSADPVRLLAAFTEAWTAKDLEAVMDLMADDCVFRASVGPEPGSSFVGRDEVRRGFGLFLVPDAGPPPATENGETLVHADFAVTRWTLRWPRAEGGPVEVRGCDVFEFEGERIKLKDTYRKTLAPLPPPPA
jgi:ketosteroid isomerase-like protein